MDNATETTTQRSMDDDHGKTRGRQHPLKSVPIEIIISVGRARPTVRELLALDENDVLPLDRQIDEPVELYVGGKLIARGELQEDESGEPGQLAVRLTEVVSLPGELD